jgi:O-methyltransferase
MKTVIKKIILILNIILSNYNLRITIQNLRKKNNLINLSKTEKSDVKKVLSLTMVSNENLKFLVSAINYLKKSNIKGDYVETGIWRGGLSILSYLTFMKNNKKKMNFYLYDTFEGMPKPGKYDMKINKNLSQVFNKWKKKSKTLEGWNYSSIKEVRGNISKICGKSSLNNFYLIKGKVENTLKIKKNLPKKICLLRLDTDFYNSTKSELQNLFKIVSKGGIIIFDDYSNWLGAKKAIDEFLKNKNYLLCKIDENSRFIIK